MWENLVTGKKYRVQMRYQGGNYRWMEREMLGLFVGRQGHELVFSLRPEFGTTEVHDHDVIGVIPAADDAKPYRPKKVA